MSHPTQSQENEAFLKMLAEELVAMPGSEILDGDNADGLRKENMAMVTMAKATAGRRRLAAGRAAFEAIRTKPQLMQEVSVAMARATIEAAMNDDQYTLAARSLGEMSDEDILRLYHQIERLKALQDKPDGDR
jgi:hypothetical protein